jgi:hypothetical protein
MKKLEEISAEVERLLDVDPEPGTAHHALVKLTDRVLMADKQDNPMVEKMVGEIPDENKLKYNREFVRMGLTYLCTRDAFPQGAVMLCRREIDLIQKALHIAGMTVQYYTAKEGSFTEAFALQNIQDAVAEEISREIRLGNPTILMQMPAMAALTAHLRTQSDPIPRTYPDGK